MCLPVSPRVFRSEEESGSGGTAEGAVFPALFPVFSWVLTLNSLIINAIHFSGLHAFSGSFCLEHDI